MHNNEHNGFSTKINEKFQTLKKRKIHIRSNGKQQLSNRMNWQHFQVQMLEGKNDKSDDKERQQKLLLIIETAMLLQEHIIDIGNRINTSSRIPLLLIFFQAALAIVFNAYNLVMFFMKLSQGKFVLLSICMSLFFYGYHIFYAALDVSMTIVAFTMVYDTIASTVNVANKLSLYVTEETLKGRLSQFAAQVTTNLRKYSVFGLYDLDGSCIYNIISGTTTYIIILMQYGLKNEMSANSR